MKIKVGYLVSYDYHMFFTSVRYVYDYADKIFLAIDKNRKTWSGNDFEIPELFFEEIKLFDVQNKIEFYFDDFYVSELSPMECETRERNMLLKVMGKGWLMQLDVDEYIYDFKKTVKFLKQHWYLNIFPKRTPIVFKGVLVTLFKELSDGYLYIENNEKFSFITNYSNFDIARNNYRVSNYLSNIKVIHQSWARSEKEMFQKIKNWGHRDDFDTQKYFEFWKDLNSENYKDYKNIHPLIPSQWDQLHFLKSVSIDDFINVYSQNNKQILTNVNALKIVQTFYKRLLKKIK